MFEKKYFINLQRNIKKVFLKVEQIFVFNRYIQVPFTAFVEFCNVKHRVILFKLELLDERWKYVTITDISSLSNYTLVGRNI